MRETTLEGLVADLVAVRHAGGYRFKVQTRVLRQFAEHCWREGYPDGSITKEALDGFLYGRHLRASTVRRNTLALCQLAEHAQAAGWDAHTPTATARARVRHQPPYVFSDEELGRLFAAIDCQGMSSQVSTLHPWTQHRLRGTRPCATRQPRQPVYTSSGARERRNPAGSEG
jgi:hypothetical protein